jgi:hypothetical protein
VRRRTSRAVGAGRREHVDGGAAEEGADLALGAADGGGRGDDLRADADVAVAALAERVEGGLVEADHRAERAGDQVELVLDDEVGREQNGAAAARPGSAGP